VLLLIAAVGVLALRSLIMRVKMHAFLALVLGHARHRRSGSPRAAGIRAVLPVLVFSGQRRSVVLS